MTIAGSGVMDSYSADSTAPWSGLAGDIETVVLPNGITSIGSEAFKGCTVLTDVAIPNSLYVIEESAFEGCTALTEMTFGTSFQEIFAGAFKGCTALSVVNFNDWLQTIDTEAFAGCTALTAIDVPGCVEVIGESAFSGCSSLATVTFGSMVQRIKAHAFQNCTALSTVNFDIPIDQIGDEAFAGCTSLTSLDLQNVSTIGVSAFSGCSELLHVSFSKWIATIKTNAFAGCSKLATVSYNDVESARANIQIQDGNGNLTDAEWSYLGGEPEGNVLTFAAESLPAGNTVEINGIAYPVVNGKVALPDDVNTGIVVEYTFHTGDPNDVHTQYPTSLKVWAIREENGVYTAERIEDLDDILQYSGSSIRITGVKGIRMITSVPTDRKATLTRAGIAGFTLKEYGTIVQWDSELNGAPLTLNTPNVKRAYAYHKDDSGAVTDPVFKTVGNLTQYTNVLVGLTDEKCIPDLALRPYMIIVDEQGIEYVIYGGTIHRSIGYIAYQNRAAFAPGSASYAYIWNIIHVVYGDQYDAEYQG